MDIHQPANSIWNGAFWRGTRTWKKASFNTFNCLLGCSIGDFGMIIYLQAKHPEVGIAMQMVLAIVAGLCTSVMLETLILRFRENFSWKQAAGTALGMSMISMIGMEIAMNTTDFLITGGEAAFRDPTYWAAFGVALIAGFMAPLPYNFYRLKKHQKHCH